MKPFRYLCVCDGGNVRSRALAYILHDLHGLEAVPVGRRWMSAETWRVFGEWADVIVIMEPHMIESVPASLRHKVTVANVGPDSYGLNLNPELMAKLGAMLPAVMEFRP